MLPEVIRAAHERTMPARAGTARTFLRLLSCIRFDEVLVLQGSPLLGAVLSMGKLTMDKAADISLLAAGSACLVAHVFLLNDWSGMSGDLQDSRRVTGVFTTKGIARTDIGYLWMALLALSLSLLAPFGSQTLTIALGIAGLSALYSAPGIHMKGIPLLNSVLHFIGGMMHFLLGYSLFRAVDARGLSIGCFFAFTFVAGHLTHEARDHEADLLNGIRTNAVMFGKAWNFAAGLALFTIADVLLFVLAVSGAVPRQLVIIAALYPLHLYWSREAVHGGLTFESIRKLQVRYRALYALVGVAMLAMAVVG